MRTLADRKKIVERYQNGESIHDLARAYSSTTNYIYKQLKTFRVKPRGIVNPKDFDKPITEYHRKIGQLLLNRRYYYLRKTTKEMSTISGFSTHKINSIERGIKDFTFLDLLKISECYDISLREIISLVE